METETMGKVFVQAKIENLKDVEGHAFGEISADAVRSIDVSDALVDTGATTLLLPKRMIQQLGLRHYKTRQARGIGGVVSLPMYSAVRLTVQGRDCTVDVGEIGDEYNALIGQVPLELLDFVVDCPGQRLIGNPAHGGEHMFDVFSLFA